MLLENSIHEIYYHAAKWHGKRKERRWKKMEKRYMERLVGKYCKIVTKEPGEDRATVVTGILEDVDYKDGFILVDSSQGLGCLRIDTIIAIKPGRVREASHKKQTLNLISPNSISNINFKKLAAYLIGEKYEQGLKTSKDNWFNSMLKNVGLK